MKNSFLLLCSLLFSFPVFSQIVFEDAYYIDNGGQRIEGQIENVDWKDNPSEFLFRTSETAASVTLKMEEVREFGIGKELKFVRKTVDIDRSDDNLDYLSEVRAPEYKEETLFLKVLVEGDANLYSYTDSNLKRYFFEKEDRETEQLIFKKYRISRSKVGYNRGFQQQLLNNVECGGNINKITNLDYSGKELVDYFLDYNACMNSESYNYAERGSKVKFNMSLRPGLNFSSMSIEHGQFEVSNRDFGSELGFRMGLEAEVVLGFNKNKWALLIEPTYQSFSSEKDGVVVDYTSLEIPFGIRHYMFLDDSSKFFVNALYMFDLPLGESIITRKPKQPLEVGGGNHMALGVGYTFADRYTLELRYFAREVLPDYSFWQSDYKTFSVIFGWRVF